MNPETQDICATCGTRYAVFTGVCGICSDERQYIPATGQKWTSLSEISKAYTVRVTKSCDEVYTLKLSPAFGITQRAHLILSAGGNILWDCIPLLDEPTIAFIKSKGGLRAISISHPHYYSIMATWANIFECPIWLHSADSKWVADDAQRVSFFDTSVLDLWDALKVIHTGGHFAGSTVLHAPAIQPSGTLFVGDTLQISPSRKFISMMYSYPKCYSA